MRKAKAKILVIDDDADVLTAARIVLRQRFEVVDTERHPHRIPVLLEQTAYDVILLDMNFNAGRTTGREGLFLLNQIRSLRPDQAVVMMTAYGQINLAVEAMKQGAADFIVKPWENESLEATTMSAYEKAVAKREVRDLKTVRSHFGPTGNRPEGLIIGSSARMRSVMQMIERVAGTDANVLLLGENGTGKGVIAQYLHSLSRRQDQPFIKVDLGAITATLFESELFGHKKGAFTDAKEDRAGRMIIASGGTLFLDEIGNLALPQQVKLLSALQNREVVPVGGKETIALDVRLICATNVDIHRAVMEGAFREDLLYRINTVEIVVPPLREHAEDIPELAHHFLERFISRYRKPGLTLHPDATHALQHHLWPGNIRELEHAIERAVAMSQGNVIQKNDLALTPAGTMSSQPATTLDDLEKNAIVKAVQKHGGNLTRAAKELRVGRTTLYRKMEKYGLTK
jgi:two-component system, NtrC family, response regulator HydG